MARLPHQELNRLSEALLGLYSPVSSAELPDHLFGVLRQFIACDFYSYNEHVGLQNERMATSPAYLDDGKIEIFNRFLYQHPSWQAVMASGTRSAVKISDFATLAEWRRTDLYNAVFRPHRQDYQLAYIDVHEMPNLAIALNRSRRDFSEEERTMLNMLRPHLLQAYRASKMLTHLSEANEAADRGYLVVDAKCRIRFANRRALLWLREYFGDLPPGTLPARLHGCLSGVRVSRTQTSSPLVEFSTQGGTRRLAVHLLPSLRPVEQRLMLSESVQNQDARPLETLGLTRREAEVLLWVAQGKSNADVARILDMHERTACKHMENILAKLYVENRTAAAQRALEILR